MRWYEKLVSLYDADSETWSAVRTSMSSMEALYGHFTANEFAEDIIRQIETNRGICANCKLSANLFDLAVAMYCSLYYEKDYVYNDPDAVTYFSETEVAMCKLK